MAVKLQQQNLTLASSLNSYPSHNAIVNHLFSKDVVRIRSIVCFRVNFMQRCCLGYSRSSKFYNDHPFIGKGRRILYLPLASTDDGVTVNGMPQASSSSELEEMRTKLDQSLQGEDLNGALIQSLHDAARAIELAIREHGSSSRIYWFSSAWLGVDKNAWVKTLSYQAAVNCLLQAAVEISSRGDGRDRDTNIFVQRSLLKQSSPLESLIREELSAKQPGAYEWFWDQQHPMVVTNFINLLERDPHFNAATTLFSRGVSSSSEKTGDISLIMLALSCIAAIMKLGPAKVSCSSFFSIMPEVIGRLMDMLIDFVPISQTYHSLKEIGLRREFLLHFGPRAAACKPKTGQSAEELAFWVDIVQQKLQRAIDRERIWSRLTTCESIEVLEKDLAIFGFFIALGRRTQAFLSANGIDTIDDPIESIIRYLIGGSVLYYPQLSSISSYQLYVEVVCEELEWLPFYPGNPVKLKQHHESKGKQEWLPRGEVIFKVLDVCSYWMESFIKYSAWLENRSNIKAARFLSRGHIKLKECVQELGISETELKEDSEQNSSSTTGFRNLPLAETELESFDQALESVEEALKRLEDLLQELHLSNAGSGKEHLKAACSDLERIRKLKKEAEFLEASFRAKAASLQQEEDGHSESSTSKLRRYSDKKGGRGSGPKKNVREKGRRLADRKSTKGRGLWNFLVSRSTRKAGTGSAAYETEDEADENFVTSATISNEDTESNEIRRFEILRYELIELEKRVQRNADGTQVEEEENLINEKVKHAAEAGSHKLVQVQKEDIISKSIVKLKETSTDVWQGTQLLAIDVAAATVLLKRALTGDELAEKEKKALRRTLTDLASVLPIGFLMLLPVTAVGHAAMLAAIQRYVPALIPSTYAPERLDLLRQLEKMKELDTDDMSYDEIPESNGLSLTNPENIRPSK